MYLCNLLAYQENDVCDAKLSWFFNHAFAWIKQYLKITVKYAIFK